MFDYDPKKWGDVSSDENLDDELENTTDANNDDPFYVSLTETYVELPPKKGTFREPDTWRRGMPYSNGDGNKKKYKKPRKSKSTGELVKLKRKNDFKNLVKDDKKNNVTNASVPNTISKSSSWVDIVKHTSN